MRVHLAPAGLEDVVAEELGGRVVERRERLFLVSDDSDCHFAQNTWLDVERLAFQSIGDAARALRERQRNWWLHSVTAHRRAQLIREKLPVVRPKPLRFPSPVPQAPLGSWTLWDEHSLLFAVRCSSAFPDGEVNFLENKTDPPSRAYLKLWEFFTLTGRWPGPGERVLDLGSSPGGWTWVLDQIGASVVSVDKAPLSGNLHLTDRVRYLPQSAFSLEPKEIGAVDWLFSDIICYPERLLELVHKWRDHARRMVCTIKFQGPTNFSLIRDFLAIPGSSVRHLCNNKHELTWSRL